MTRRAARLGVLVLVCSVLSACALRRPPEIMPTPGSLQEGMASWYGKGFHGRRTASGEVYDMNGLTAAHRTLPFGTVLRVENRGNGKSVDVTVNDRGPFIRGRIVDLSYGAARAIGLIGEGVAPVRLVVLAHGTSRDASEKSLTEADSVAPFTVQVGVFGDPANAVAAKNRIGDGRGSVSIIRFNAPDGRRLYRVVVGTFKEEKDAESYARRLDGEGLGEAFVTRRDPQIP